MAQNDQHYSGEQRPLRQIVLLLVTAAISFTLGMIIGRSSAPVQPIIKVSMPEVHPPADQKLNFYKALPKGETTALGSGINHSGNHPTPTPSPVASPQRETTLAEAVSEETTAASAATSAKKPANKEENQESWVLQAASMPREQDAQSLSKKLRNKGYKTEVKAVKIKGKTWFRVYVGPYTTAMTTKEAAAKLSRHEGLSPIARKN